MIGFARNVISSYNRNWRGKKHNHTRYKKPMEETLEVHVRHKEWSEKEVKSQNKCIWCLELPSTHCIWTLSGPSNILPEMLNIDLKEANMGLEVLSYIEFGVFLITFLIDFAFIFPGTSMPWVIFFFFSPKNGLAKSCSLWQNILKP